MQSQVPLDPYVGLWSRLRDFDPSTLGDALLARRAVRMTFLRVTLHLVCAADALRLRPALQRMLERAYASSTFARSLAGLDLAPVLARSRQLLTEEPRTTAQLRDALGEEWPGYDRNALAYAARYLLPLVQITPRGVWGRTLQPTMTTLEHWLGSPLGEEEPFDELVCRYLRAFGPATAADVRAWSWLGGARQVLDGLAGDLRTYRDERGRILYDVEDGSIADPSTPAPVRFLPQYDNVFLSHADRDRVFDRVRWDGTFMHHGVLLVDGFLAGAWKVKEQTLEIGLRVKVSPAQRRDINEEVEGLLVFLSPGTVPRIAWT